MAEEQLIPINITIADRTYRIRTSPEDEEVVRKTLKIINDKIVEFKDGSNKTTHRFGLTDKNVFAQNLAQLKTDVEALAKMSPEEIAASLESEEGIKPELAAIAQATRLNFLEGRIDQEVLLNSFLSLAQ